jgi:hypothetical protein
VPLRPVAVLDAAVLVPAGVRDVLLSLADGGAFRPASFTTPWWCQVASPMILVLRVASVVICNDEVQHRPVSPEAVGWTRIKTLEVCQFGVIECW